MDIWNDNLMGLRPRANFTDTSRGPGQQVNNFDITPQSAGVVLLRVQPSGAAASTNATAPMWLAVGPTASSGARSARRSASAP